jgi:hypothetical protein
MFNMPNLQLNHNHLPLNELPSHSSNELSTIYPAIQGVKEGLDLR